MEYKVGQVWGNEFCRECITYITEFRGDILQVHIIRLSGSVWDLNILYFNKIIKENEFKLLASFDTWQEAVNSKEFKGE